MKDKSIQDSFRVFHGRGKLKPQFEHVAIDYFSPNLLITLYKEDSMEFIDALLDSLKEISDLWVENILLQKRYQKSDFSRPELIAIKGSIPTQATALERGSKFHLKFGEAQNIGFFLDMSPGREMLERLSKNKKVLNLFSYTCSLSVAAMKGGASLVVNVDMSKAALSVGESNHFLNELDITKVRFLPYDIMKSWNKIYKNGPYDIIVIDPPSNQGDSFQVERDYKKIIKRLNDMASSEAIILSCLNSPHLTSQFLIDLFGEYAPEYTFQETIYSGFSSMEKNPEEALKIVVFKGPI